MASILAGIEEGDEVIVPSYTFVSTANPFLLRGARVIFCDSNAENPNIDASNIEEHITPRTKAIVVVHYAGISCDMQKIMSIANKHGLLVIEDAAQGLDSYHLNRPLGSIGHFAAFSFHETKNLSSGEGGMLVVNDSNYHKRAEIIWDKGTNRAAFFRGEVDKYNWVDVGSSFLPSEVMAAFLYAQLDDLESIQQKRKNSWALYYQGLEGLEESNHLRLPKIPSYATNNAQIFYLILSSPLVRERLISFLKSNGIQATFHYQSLHNSDYFKHLHKEEPALLPNSEKYSDQLLRLPLHYYLNEEEIKYIIKKIHEFFES